MLYFIMEKMFELALFMKQVQVHNKIRSKSVFEQQ